MNEPNSVLYYDVEKGLNFVLEFSIHPSLISQIKVIRELNNLFCSCCCKDVSDVNCTISGKFSGEEKQMREKVLHAMLHSMDI